MPVCATAPAPRTAQYWIDALQLRPHPEGGFYRGVSRVRHSVLNQAGDVRPAYTTIYFLLTPQSPSHLHRLRADEVLLYHAGDPLLVHAIYRRPEDAARLSRAGDATDAEGDGAVSGDGWTPSELPSAQATAAQWRERKQEEDDYSTYHCISVGPHVDMAQQLQCTVPADAIFGSSVAEGGEAGYALVSCIVSPGFDYRDFELFTQSELMALCPQHEKIIRELAYETLPNQ